MANAFLADEGEQCYSGSFVEISYIHTYIHTYPSVSLQDHRADHKRQKDEQERKEFEELRWKMSHDKERQEDMRCGLS